MCSHKLSISCQYHLSLCVVMYVVNSALLLYLQYFYNAETQQYLYWDSASKTYVPVAGSTADGQTATPVPALPGDISVPSATASTTVAGPSTATAAPVATAAVLPAVDESAQKALEASEKREEGDAAGRSEKKEKEEKPRSLAAFKVSLTQGRVLKDRPCGTNRITLVLADIESRYNW